MTNNRVEAALGALSESSFVTEADMRAALAAADAAFDDRWYGANEEAYETLADAFDPAPLGAIEELSENVTLSTESWQLVPVTEQDELCPCGKPEGCGDFLGVECKADREEARRWLSLPEGWQL